MFNLKTNIGIKDQNLTDNNVYDFLRFQTITIEITLENYNWSDYGYKQIWSIITFSLVVSILYH